MYAQVAIKPNPLLRNGAYGIVMRGVQKCTRGCSSLRGRNKLPLCCIKLDTATDPCCGSGTVLIEGALLANNIAPGINRNFDVDRWGFIPESVWMSERERCRDLIKTDTDFVAFGTDIDPKAIELTLKNAKNIGVDKFIRASVADIKNFDPTTERGTLITNPPYGERMLDVREAEKIYRIMGDKFVAKHGWSYGIISPDEEFEKCFGRKADKRRKLYNGMIKCQYYMYFK